MDVSTGTILEQIFAHKRTEIAGLKRQQPLSELRAAAETAPAVSDFLAALRWPQGDGPALIAEIKRASPSRGRLAGDFDLLDLALTYQANGAAAISVLTDERYFQGSLADLQTLAAAEPVRLPLLRKDFICDAYQVYQARLAGAAAVLLIASYLDPVRLAELQAQVVELGMAPLIEVHQLSELEMALRSNPPLIGVNNRDLRDFSVDLDTTLALSAYLPEEALLVAESGIHTRADIQRLEEANVSAILVGEALVTARDIPAKVRELACYR